MSKNFLFLRIFLLSKKAKNIYSSSKKNILIKKKSVLVSIDLQLNGAQGVNVDITRTMLLSIILK